MRLTVFTEYSLLVLIYLARHADRFVTIAEIADAHGISGNHLMKVVQHLAKSGDVVTLRGPRGGARLARAPEAIRFGDVVRGIESDPTRLRTPGRGVHPGRGLSDVLDQARAAFIAVLDGCTVADVVSGADAMPQAGPRIAQRD